MSRRSWRAYLPRPATDLPTQERPTGAAAKMGAATLASRGVGFVRVWMITTVLGTSYLGNSYQATSSVSNVLFELLAAGALSAVLVPTFVELLHANRRRDTEELASGLLGLAVVGLGVVALVGLALVPWIADVLTIGAPKGPIADRQHELSTFLLYFFIPQVVLYAFGTIATAVLYAQRRFTITALAPIANTVVLVVVLAIFHVVHPGTGLDLTLGDKLLLAIGATLGVVGFCGVPVVALWVKGFRFWPRLGRPDAVLRKLLGLSGWAVLQHMGIGVLLAASIVMGNQVAGGVVAYQFAFVTFMAPFAILAQPVAATILPALALDASAGDDRAFALRTRWALESLALLTLPVSAAMIALAEPAISLITVGGRSNPDLLAAALASLAVGLLPYSAFLLLARAFYARGDSRTPAVVALVTACVGAAVMVVGGLTFHGSAAVAALGIGNSVAYLLGAAVLAVLLRRRLHHAIIPVTARRPLVASLGLGTCAWLAARALAPSSRLADLVVVALIGFGGGAAYLVALRALGRVRPAAPEPFPPPKESEPTVDDMTGLMDPDLAEDL
ncbi:MAG TPA: lipid II flippase MurJ [Acidimicrobiia bacterium]|nr:lipid II flippase MurJ [Acidimicrobiia bacterium]